MASALGVLRPNLPRTRRTGAVRVRRGLRWLLSPGRGRSVADGLQVAAHLLAIDDLGVPLGIKGADSAAG